MKTADVGSFRGDRYLFWCAVLAFVPTPGLQSVNLGVFLFGILLVIKPSVWKASSPSSFSLLVTIALLGGLTQGILFTGAADGRQFQAYVALIQVLLFVNLVGHALLAIRCLQVFGATRAIAVLAASGILGGVIGALTVGDNAWKYWVGVPVTALALVGARKTKVRGLLACVILAGISLSFDTRNIAIAVLVAGIVLTIAPASGMSSFLRSTGSLAIAGLISFTLLFVVPFVVNSGFFGEELANRSAAQTATFGALGARLEYAGALGLAGESWAGLGTGVLPSAEDVTAVRTGLRDIGAPTDSEYFRDRVLGGSLEFHSIGSDLWLKFGLAGLLAACASAGALGRAFWVISTRSVDRGYPIVAGAYLVAQGVWDFMFSPLYANGSSFGLALGVAIWLATGPNNGEPPAPVTRPTSSTRRHGL